MFSYGIRVERRAAVGFPVDLEGEVGDVLGGFTSQDSLQVWARVLSRGAHPTPPTPRFWTAGVGLAALLPPTAAARHSRATPAPCKLAGEDRRPILPPPC